MRRKPEFGILPVGGIPEYDYAYHEQVVSSGFDFAYFFCNVENLAQLLRGLGMHHGVMVESGLHRCAEREPASSVRTELCGEYEQLLAIFGSAHIALPLLRYGDAVCETECWVREANGVFAVGHEFGKVVRDSIHGNRCAILAQFGFEIMPKRPAAYGKFQMEHRGVAISIPPQEHGQSRRFGAWVGANTCLVPLAESGHGVILGMTEVCAHASATGFAAGAGRVVKVDGPVA